MSYPEKLVQLFGAPRHLRLVLQCRDSREVTLAEDLAFAFARDAGLAPLDMWYVGACAFSLGSHLVARGGGQLALTVVELPRPAVQLRAICSGPTLGALPDELRAAEEYADELDIVWCPGVGSVITARRWLGAR